MGIQGRQDAAQFGHDARLFRHQQELVLAGSGGVDIHSWEYAAFRDPAVQLQFRVARALEFLEDDGIAGRTGLHHRGGDDGERTALFDIAGSAQEALWRVERIGIHTTGQDAARCRGGVVVRTAQAGDGIQQHHNILALLHQTLCAFDGQLGNGGVL